MLKSDVVGGERVAKLNELVRLTEYDLIEGMAELSSASPYEHFREQQY
ncbi:MAG TPA: hypothetical protein VE692_04305 [Nitrososphaera sp.]|jgi:enolase|nr:hypothetical protein [Nitrososphaera sp.]